MGKWKIDVHGSGLDEGTGTAVMDPSQRGTERYADKPGKYGVADRVLEKPVPYKQVAGE